MSGGLERLYQLMAPLGIYRLRQNSRVDMELRAYAAGFALVEELIRDLWSRAFVQTAAGEALARYENMVGLPPRPELDDKTRRDLILYRLSVAPFDFNLSGLLGSIRAAGMVAEIAEDFAGEAIVIRCVELIDTETDLDRLQMGVNAMLPAHLEAEYDIGELIWDLFDSAEPTWNDWDSRNMNWAEFDLDGHSIFPAG